MAGWDDVRRIALSLPETSERPSHDAKPAWRVKDQLFVWERPLRRADLAALGDAAPEGPILGVWVEDLGAKEALLASEPDRFLTTPHFDCYAIVLAQLDRVPLDELEELIVEAWLLRAPRRLATRYLADRPHDAPGSG